MRVLGFEITRTKSGPLQSVYDGNRGWFPVVREPFTGAWQRNRECTRETILTYSAVYACVTLIASDIGKLRVCLVEQDADGIWTETESPAFSPVLRKPNRYQNRIKFYEQWVVSKLLHGNAYILKERDNRGVVVSLYILDPCRCKPKVAPDGSVFYEIERDNLSGVEESLTVPASEIIHDTMVSLYHPLCGVSPLTACGLAAAQGLTIQNNTYSFFKNGAKPSGIVTAPENIDEADAARIKAFFEENFTGPKAGSILVAGSGLSYQSMMMNAVDSQLIEQLKWGAETVCSAFHVPPYMIGVGPPPNYNNIEALNMQYYSQSLQKLIESIEICLDEGLGTVDVPGKMYGTEFELDGLLRMDTATRVKTYTDAVKGGLYKPNEGRKKFDLPPVKGGDEVYLQQQNYSLAALAKRDAQADPFGTAPAATPAPDMTPDQIAASAQIAAWKLKSLLAA